MKHLLLLLALLCLAQRSAAQGGKIYRSLDDYRNDRYETVPDLYLKPPVDEAVFGRFGYKLACTDRETKKTLKATTFAVVGDTLYVNLAYLCDTTRENSLQCLPAERIDRYVLLRYFSGEQISTVSFNWAMFGLAGAAASYDRQRDKVPYFCLDLQTGKVELIDREVMTRIIGGYPDLLKSYLSLQEPESRATIDDYLNLYRQRKLRGEPELPIPERPIATAGRTEDSIPSITDFSVIYATAEDYLCKRGEIAPDIRFEPFESLHTRDVRNLLLWPVPVTEDFDLIAKLKNKTLLIERNDSLSRRKATEFDMFSIPTISTVKPRNIAPISFFLPRLENRFIKMPIIASFGIHVDGLRKVSIAEAPSPASMPESETIHAVSAAPRFEPIITPTDCRSDIVPELTKPTTMTVVAELL